jgi:hypothetical protein
MRPGGAASSSSDPQDHRVPRSREYRGRQKMENVTVMAFLKKAKDRMDV